ncbi:unnamed protein product [Orchesella dallaii]|uniref:Guanylate-binding protein N-terminal domain-containing protein n=1 Tax=Orchesella dallaii TaxID=48710 RepID=A0ABP1RV88_9HEXA
MSSLSSSNSSFYSQESETNLDERPLQLVETAETDNNENNSPKLKINEESLQTVLQSSEGRQLSIIAVVGPPSSGKSFLLNAIKSALEAKEGGRSISSSTSNFLNGFKCNTVTDSKACTTTGIWIWSRAFLPSENDTAVILLDTQGLTNCEASSAIFGLSFLSSSILIYNIEANSFDTSRFSPLSPYFKYGFGCLEKDEELSEEEPPFQTLAFLFRDWSDVETYPYGREGGKSFLNEKLATLRGRLKIETKEGLKCFQQVTPYLIPEMGGFPGSFQHINPEFLTHLEKFIETLLDDENLLPNKIFGVELNPTDFTNFLKQYVNTYNDLLHSKKKMVEEDLILEATCTTFHSNILNRCLEKYKEIYEKRRQKLTSPNSDDIQNIHESAVRQANFTFKREKKLADYEDSCKEQLHMEMSSLLEKKLKETNANRTQYVQACFENAVVNFKEKISKQTNLNSEVSSELMENSIVEFLSNFSNDDDENTLELAGSLEKELEEILENFQEKPKPFPFRRSKPTEKRLQQKKDVDLEAAKQYMEDLHSQLVQQYEKEMYDVITSTIPTPTPSSLLAYHEHCLDKIIKTFSQVSEENPFAEETQTELENSIHQVYTTIEEELSNASMQQKKEQAEAFLNEEVETHSKSLISNERRGSKTTEVLHNQMVWESMSRFNEKCPFPPGTSDRKELELQLRSSLDTNYNSKKKKSSIDTSAEKQMSVNQIKEICLQQYEADMNTLRHGAQVLETQKLVKAHQNSERKVLSMYEKLSKSSSDSPGENGNAENFKEELEKEFAKMKIDNERELDLAKANAKISIHECLKEYQKLMKELADSCTNAKSIQQAHEKTKKVILLSFSKKWKSNCSKSFRQEQEKILETEMDATYEELEDFFKMRLNTDVVSIESLKTEARKYYHAEMAKNIKPKIHTDPTQLQELHKRIGKEAIEMCKSKASLKSNQKKLLKSWLQESYQKYKDENDMLLNYAEGTEPAIGIDLGTTYCCAAVFMNGKVEIVRNPQGHNTTPSYVNIKPSGEKIVGTTAKDNAHRNAENTVFDAKRMIGRRFDDPQLQNDINFWPFTIVQGAEGPAIEVNKVEYPPEQIASFILIQLASDAEKFLGQPVRKAVITVPAYFNDGQRQATIDAGELAGLEVLTILNEPTAASIAYKLERFHEDARNVLIFDLGGGTFDVAIVKTNTANIEILAVDGDTHLGGEDFDKAMMQYCAREFQNETNIDPFIGNHSEQQAVRQKAKQRLRRLQSNCEKGKKELSFAREAIISVDNFADGEDLSVEMTREKFEELVAGYLKKALVIVERAIEGAKIKREDIDDIVLVGGSTRMPKVQEMLSKFFNGKALNHTINPDEAVAYGAAVKAALMNGDQAKKMFNFSNIKDVTPMSLGLEAWVNGVGGHFSPIIPKSSQIPVEVDQFYNTLIDNQNSVLMKVYQGENPLAKDNEFLGEFILNGIPPAPAGKECVQVSMCVGETGIVHVSAVCKSDKSKGAVETLVVKENKGRLSTITKDRLLNEAKTTDHAVLRRSNTHMPKTNYEKVKDTKKRNTFLGKILR